MPLAGTAESGTVYRLASLGFDFCQPAPVEVPADQGGSKANAGVSAPKPIFVKTSYAASATKKIRRRGKTREMVLRTRASLSFGSV